MSSDFDFVRLDTSLNKQSFLKECKDGKYSQLKGIYRHNTSADSIGVFDAELVAGLPESMKVLAHNGAGYDQIDIQACSKRGIQVSNTPAAVDDATATTAMFLILSCFRQYWPAQVNVREGKFKQGLKPAHDPEDKLLGIVGMGGIGSAIAKRAQGFGMKVAYHNRNPVSQDKLEGLESVTYEKDLHTLLAKADCVALSLPLNANTKGFFDSSKFNAMKDGAILVNTARGGVLDEEAMISALESGKLSTIGLDVYPNEPEINSRLVSNPKAVLLPHVGTETEESQEKMEVRALDNLVEYFKGGKVRDTVIEQKGKL
ncbi:hypothetical protein EMMF5_005139 [Cystobasidiomycetes sp. EMM_F5]